MVNTSFQVILLLAGGALILYLLARLFSMTNKSLAIGTSLVLFLAGWVLVFGQSRLPGFNPNLTRLSTEFLVNQELVWPGESASRFIAGIAIILGLIISIFSGQYMGLDRRYKTYYSLLLLTIAGLIGMVYAKDLFLLYLFSEWMSISAYILVAFRYRTNTAIEAGFKYLIMGSVGTMLFLLGLAWIYRDTGQIAIPFPAFSAGSWAQAGVLSALIGLGIKSAYVPLHTWLPDAHSRAPSSISALLSGIIIQSCFFVWLRVGVGLGVDEEVIGLALIWLSVLNMIVGNLMALVQTHVKRLLAFSSIAQMGYIMFSFGIGLRFGVAEAIHAGFLYLAIHAAFKSLAFLSKGTCHYYCETTSIEEMRGISTRLPLPALTMSLALAGLACLPPLMGFSGKWFILSMALRVQHRLVSFGIIIFLVSSLISLGYYLPLIVQLYSGQPASQKCTTPRVHISGWIAFPLIVLSGVILAASFYPAPWIDLLFPAILLQGGR